MPQHPYRSGVLISCPAFSLHIDSGDGLSLGKPLGRVKWDQKSKEERQDFAEIRSMQLKVVRKRLSWLTSWWGCICPEEGIGVCQHITLLSVPGLRNPPRPLLVAGPSSTGSSDSDGGLFAVPTTLPPNSRHGKLFSPSKEAELTFRQHLDSISVSAGSAGWDGCGVLCR